MPPRQRKAVSRAPRQPQDHLPKARQLANQAGLTPFQFEHEGTVYELPRLDPDEAHKATGKLVRDAVMNPESEAAQLRLTIATLELAVTDPATLEALYAKPWSEVGAIVNAWLEAQGADPGKSDSSPA